MLLLTTSVWVSYSAVTFLVIMLANASISNFFFGFRNQGLQR